MEIQSVVKAATTSSTLDPGREVNQHWAVQDHLFAQGWGQDIFILSSTFIIKIDLLNNQYTDFSVQKGRIPMISDCLELPGEVTQLIREAQEGKGELAVICLDLANAYGSVPQKLVESALERHHIPSNIKNLILNYYEIINVRFTSSTVTSALAWKRDQHWMHNLSDQVTTTSVPGNRWILQGLERLITWPTKA